MMEWLINVGLTFGPVAGILITLTCLVYLSFRKHLKKYPVFKTLGGVLVLLFVFFATQPSITYKHTTNYNKERDVYAIKIDQPEPTTSKLEDKTLKPDQNKDQRKNTFDNLIKY